MDLVCPLLGAAALAVLTNDGSGGFSLATAPPVGVGPVSVAAADVNADGPVDLISANANGGGGDTLTVLFNSRQLNGVFAGNGTGLNGVNAGLLDGIDSSDFQSGGGPEFHRHELVQQRESSTARRGSTTSTISMAPAPLQSTFNGSVAVGSSAAVSFGSRPARCSTWGTQYGLGVQSRARSTSGLTTPVPTAASPGIAAGRIRIHSSAHGGSTLMTLNANRLSVNTAVGLGTTDPAAKLHLYSTDNPTTFRIQSTGTPGFGALNLSATRKVTRWNKQQAYIQSLDKHQGRLVFILMEPEREIPLEMSK